MDNSEIPVLTKKVQTSPPDSTIRTPTKEPLNAVDMELLVSQVRNSVLNALTEQLVSQIGEQIAAQIKPQLMQQAAEERNTLSEYAQLVQTSLDVDMRTQQNEYLSALEQSVRDGFAQLQQQHIAQIEATFSASMQAHEAQLSAKVDTLQSEMLDALSKHAAELQAQTRQALGDEHQALTVQLNEAHLQSLQASFSAFAAEKTEEIKDKLGVASAMNTDAIEHTVEHILLAQMDALENRVLQQLKTRIVEVLQGIRFVMPNS